METLTFDQLPSAFVLLFSKIEKIERILEQKAESKVEGEILLTIQEAAQFLSLSVPTLYGLVSKAQLNVNKKGKRLYFSKSELTNWIREGRKKTTTEIKKEAEVFIIRMKG